jgi:hypothetical protein
MKCLYENLKCQIIKPNEVIIVDSSDLQDIDYGWFQDNWVLKELYIVRHLQIYKEMQE